ncbi:MAG: glucose-6-phosphate dehydrogenase assembly protein OpcA [Planctomycetes bacterium]|nr:glucose-6-phosphate dehydrogenase assembly protein OpcA [Planctomycetota bacterium]
MTAAPAPCRTAPVAVPLPKIPDALRGLWRACAAGNTNADDGDVTRSLAINFVGVTTAADEGALRGAVERLHLRTPCRAFLLVIDPAATAVTAAVSATTRAHGSTQDIVLEEIAVRLPESGFERMPGLVRPLLVNDLPNHLYWAAPWPRTEPHFDDLARLCDHTVVDTRSFRAPERELTHVGARRERGQRITDLSWLRLRPWRRALAEAFERIPWQAGSPATATIRHGAAATSSALLLGDWLNARLAARIVRETDADAGSCPTRVTLRTGHDEVDLANETGHVTAHVTTKEFCHLPYRVPLSRGRDGDLLAAAIDLG